MKNITIMKLTILVAVIMFFAVGTFVYAQENTMKMSTDAVAQVETVKPVRFVEKVKLFFTFNSNKKAEILQDFSSRNFELAKQKIEEGDVAKADVLLKKSDNNLNSAVEVISKTKSEDSQVVEDSVSLKIESLLQQIAALQAEVAHLQGVELPQEEMELEMEQSNNSMVQETNTVELPQIEEQENSEAMEETSNTELPEEEMELESETANNESMEEEGGELPEEEMEIEEGSSESMGESNSSVATSCDDNAPHMHLEWYPNIATSLTVQSGQEDIEFARLKITNVDCDIDIDKIIVNSYIPNSDKIENIRVVVDGSGQTVLSEASLPASDDPNIEILAGTAKALRIYADVKSNATPGTVRLGISDIKRTLVDSGESSYPISSTPAIGFTPNGVYGNTVTIVN